MAAEPAELNLPALFGDHMIVQRDLPIRVWGTAQPGAAIRVEMAGKTGEAVAAPDGRWSVTLEALAAGGPYDLYVAAGKERASLVFSDVLVGDIWLCSGQSNMERPVSSEKDAAMTLAAAGRPRIRMFLIRPALSTEPQADLPGRWEVCTSGTLSAHSAIGYHFIRKLQEELGDVPVGMIEAGWSGRGAECFMARDWLSADPRLKPVLAVTDRAEAEFKKRLASWEEGGAQGQRPRLPQSRPPFIFNGMIAPLTPFRIRGVVWYQGESNIMRADQYRIMLPALIQGWRGAWGQGDFPFLVVQLANFELREAEKPFESVVAELREAQMAALELPQTAVIVSADLGEGNDAHPRGRKGINFHQEVAGRLAAAALALAHDRKTDDTFPSYQTMDIVGAAIRLRFNRPGSKLTLREGAEGFAVASVDRRFFPADARLDGDSVVVSSPQVPEPVAVRYGWASNPKLSLFSRAGLPAVPFRTDNWSGLTAGHDTVENDDPAL